jgi:hypothetical protein
MSAKLLQEMSALQAALHMDGLCIGHSAAQDWLCSLVLPVSVVIEM